MSNEDDTEIQMIMDKKSRFSRYRTRIQERKQLDIMEMMTTDDLNETPYVYSYFLSTVYTITFTLNREDEACVFDQRMVLDDSTTSTLEHDEYNPASDSILKEATKQHASERDNDNDNNYEDEVDDLYRFYNDRNNIRDGNDGDKADDDEHDEDEYEDEDEDESEGEDDGIEESPDFQHNFYDNYFENERLPDVTELFSCSNETFKKNNPTLLEGNHFFICPSCGNKCANASKCNLTRCQSSNFPVRTPTSVVVFPLAPQMCSIHERETLIMPTYELNQCDDLSNSQRAQEVARKEKQNNPARNNVTLTLNTDGILLKRISRSLWITCACINELPRKKRYDINNILICSISTGDEKPKKGEYSTILQDIVNELKFLEQVGFDVLLPSTVKTHNRTYTHFHAFTIAAVCDKPAQAIMMNIKDPTGFFSCGWCCIPG
ncbi:unnamed protein product [Rotaria sp. Silwood2]|nr:unnamed protein product [Rotaria sp. Silwood2]CAF3323125.1 unnamed protein product [Rotaria sp. Silwood2]CAF4181791.1 unnamed protein product [Rotaria sp. Silwood2]CAF4227184.1 unnamed protein product [Rotaria sp. Silwood2]